MAAPPQSPGSYVQSPALLVLADLLGSVQRATGDLPLVARQQPACRQYLEVAFFYYAERAPGFAQHLSTLLYCLEHAGPAPASGAE